MKARAATASLMKNKLSSITKNLLKDEHSFYNAQGESYSSLVENDFIDSKKFPETGFALNIDCASYSNMRRFLNNDIYVPTDAIRIEEMLNYFNFSCCKQEAKHNQFLFKNFVTTCPWNKNSRLLFIDLNAPKLNLDSVPPSNLVFLIDISGSMDKPNRLPLLQSAFKMLVENLREKDTVAIVVYGGGVFEPLGPTSGAEKQKINDVIDSLYANGDTPGEGAIRTAYSSAKHSFIKNGNNRVILATDGDFNVGQSSEKQLEEMIAEYRNSGIYLSCLGVGMGNYKDSKLEALAKRGNGNFAYIDNVHEAQKVLVTEFTKTLYSVANDAFLNMTFDSKLVKDYRLIGFDNPKASIQDSTSELEGGEVGSGHTLIAIFEIEPETSLSDDSTCILARGLLQFRLPNSNEMYYQKLILPNQQPVNINQADSSIRFATAVSMFGSLLKQSKFAKGYTFTDVFNLAAPAIDPTNFSQAEFLTLVQKADRIYNPTKKKKRKGEDR
jgi:Ca-activated chloride channel family protein